jgi:hypothetical protein
MKLIRWLLIFAFASPLLAQNTRFDLPIYTVQASGGNLLPVYAIPGAAIKFYSCSGSDCTTLATTYISATSGTTCPTSPTPMQVVLQGTTTCVSSADPYGNMGGWFQSGQYMATITTLGTSYNYFFTIGGTSASVCPGSGCVLLNPTLSQNIVQPPGTSLGETSNYNGPNIFALSNSSSGANAVSAIFFTNDVGAAVLGLGSSGVVGGASDFTVDNSIAGASTTIQANVGDLVFKTGPTSTALTISPTNQATFTSGLNWGTDSGTANAYVVTRPAGSTTLYDGEDASFIALNNSNGPSTMNLDGSGVLPFDKNGTTALGSGDILSGATYNIKYNLATTTWQLLNSSLTGGGGTGCGTGSNCVITNPSAGQVITQPASTQLGVNIENGSYYAAQFGASTGIASAIAQACTGLGCDVVAGADYANTESLPANIAQAGGFGTGNYLAMPNWPGLTRVRDERGGFDSQIFVAPTGAGSYYPAGSNANFPYGLYFNSAYDVTIPGNSVTQNTYAYQAFFNGPGNQINGFGGVNLKSYDFGPVFNMTSSDQGQHIGGQWTIACHGVGDCLGLSWFITETGGASTFNDEGAHGGQTHVVEDNNVFTGTITSTQSSGATTFQTSVTTGAGAEGDGEWVMDTASANVVNGVWPTAYITATTPNVGQSPPLETFSGATFTPSWVAMTCDPSVSTCNNGLDPTGKINSAAGGYAPGLTTLDIVTAAPSKRSGYATSTAGIASSGIVAVSDSQNFETTTYTVLSTSQIQINLRKPHNDGMTIAVGGPNQNALEVTGATFQYTSGGTHYRQVFPVVGAYSSTQLMIWDHDSQQGYSNAAIGHNSSAYCTTDSNPTTFSASGDTVTVFETSPNVPDAHAAGQTAIVTTANSTYNGTVTLTYLSAFHGGIYRYAYQYTLGSAPSGSAPTSGTIQFCNTGFNLYPALEVLSVLSPTANSVNGYFSVAPNSIVGTSVFADTDTVEEPHYMWQQNSATGGLNAIDQKLPRAPLNNFQLAGYSYNSFYTGGYPGFSIVNATDTQRYLGYGGEPGATDPNRGYAPSPQAAYYIGGLWNWGLESALPPALQANASPGSILEVDNCQPAPYNCTDPLNSPFGIYFGPSGGADQILDNTPAKAIMFDSPIQLGGLGFPDTIYSPVFGTLAVSQDLGSSFTPDGTWEGKFFQFYGTTPPTHYLNLELYGDSSTSIGMQFPSADAGVHPTFQGGTLSSGGYQLYVPATASAAKTAGFSPTSTVGQISCDDATIGDSGCQLLLKNLQINNLVSAVQLGTDSSGNVVKIVITPVQVSVSSGSLGANTCSSDTTVAMAGLVLPSGSTPGTKLVNTQEGRLASVTGWGATGGMNFYSYVSATNQMSWYLCNATGSSISYGAINVDVSN